MSELSVLQATKRQDYGTGAARALRREGKIPAIIYSKGKEPISVVLEEKEVTKLYRAPAFTAKIVEIQLGKEKYKVIPKTADLHPVTELVTHADFIFLGDKTQKVDVPVKFVGKERSIGIKRGGFLNIVSRKVPLECPIKNIPEAIEVDVSNVRVGKAIMIRDLNLPQGCEIATKKNLVIASMIGKGGKKDEEDSAENAA